MPILLCTLGTSWAVVPEAFLVGNGDTFYSKVAVVATSSIDFSIASCEAWFREYAPQTELCVYRIEDLPDIRDIDDHNRFEEALFRVYANFYCQYGRENVHVCLAGGFKTISSSAHQAADLLGCGKLFHVVAPSGTKIENHEQIIAGIESETIRFIDLGTRSGWSTIQELLDTAPPLPTEGEAFVISNTNFQQQIINRVREANRLAQSQDELVTLPFSKIARWAPAHRDWLHQPLDWRSETDKKWISELPKIELHCHLGGFATEQPLLEEVRAAAQYPDQLPELQDITLPKDWPLPSKPVGLEEYRKYGDNNGSAILRDRGCLKRHIELLYRHFQEQNIQYAEVRCSPANYVSNGRSAWDVLSEILKLFTDLQAAAEEICDSAPLVNIIIIATRQSGGDYRTQIARHLTLASTASEHWRNPHYPQVVGVDLAGYEDKETRAHYYKEDFTAPLRLGMGITVHAGENDDSEAIWSAILNINAQRLGHALRLKAAPSLLESVANRRIAVEMCPYANLQIVGFPLDQENKTEATYPLWDYLRKGILATVNTDNIGISGASLTDNFLLLPRLCPGITRLDILQLLRNAIDAAFLSQEQKQNLHKKIQLKIQYP